MSDLYSRITDEPELNAIIGNIWNASAFRGAQTVIEDPERIPVTRPFLPPLEEYMEYLQDIWSTGQLTNNGKYHTALEQALCERLGVKYISLFSNGTLALLTALQVMRASGQVITTPYSFVATTHALHWNEITPVFADIEPGHFNLDPDQIERQITPDTTAILPVHVYGNPCRTRDIQALADAYGLKVIYDAAHAFGVEQNYQSILTEGDVSVLSFHATKVFTTFEGGAIVSHDEATKKRIDYLKNFGFAGETTVVGPGINGKMNELQAAMGLLQLKYLDQMIEARQAIAIFYRELLRQTPGITLLQDIDQVKHNYSYFPILVDGALYGESRDDLYNRLKQNGIYGRRYFYPLISQFPTYKGLPSAAPGKMPVAERIAEQIICLPIYPDLPHDDVCRIARVITDPR